MGFSMKMILNSIKNMLHDHESDILMGAGTAGVLGGTAMMCKATTKLPKIISEYKTEKQRVIDNLALEPDEEMPKEAKVYLRKLKLKTCGKVAVAYGPGAVVEVGSLVGMWKGYGKVKTTCIGLSTAYMGLKAGFDKYRSNVKETYGEEADKKMLYGYREQEVVHTEEDGTTTSETIHVYPQNSADMPSPYARYFCYGEADAAEKSYDYNLDFVRQAQIVAQNMLNCNRKLMLNDVYEMLGIKHSVAGNHVGWINHKGIVSGDGRVDLRIQTVYREVIGPDGQPAGWERVIMIDPNVDGAIEEKCVSVGLLDR